MEAREEAISRARAIGGRVVWSWPPSARPDDGSGWGYWSEPGDAGAFLRRGERVVWESAFHEARRRYRGRAGRAS